MRLKLSLLCSALLVHTSAVASQAELFESLSKAMSSWQAEENNEAHLDEFERFKSEHRKAFAAYLEQHFAEYDAFRAKVIQQWGDIKTSSNAEFVAYSDDFAARVALDFAANAVTISIRHEAEQPISEQQIQNRYKAFLLTNSSVVKAFENGSELPKIAVKDKAVTRTITNNQRAKAIAAAKKQVEQQTEQQLKVLEINTDNAILDGGEAEHVVNDTVEQKKTILKLKNDRIKNLLATAQNLVKEDPPDTTVVTEVVISLPKGNIASKRAARYLTQVQSQSERFELPASLVLAVMHTESHFNPMAKSHIPAYGLMQIVPTSAGVDVNRYLYNLDEPMSAPYLYVSDNNIEAGSAYLHILNSRYLRNIENPTSRKYCMIAAYNTGAGNVARVFNDDNSRSILKASKVINTLSPQNVLAALEAGLPYDETKHYLQKVLARESLYTENNISEASK
ncbi:murein transglycosylase domain-containing protein [Pseudoalteromonas sp. T1lg65]|uniref:transglycosylase SLT domain-containing protein n=1 Tax=Pseudoalteromonas sp. T1lg65 TaxID=2077101 RepID=UPI003F79FD9A